MYARLFFAATCALSVSACDNTPLTSETTRPNTYAPAVGTRLTYAYTDHETLTPITGLPTRSTGTVTFVRPTDNEAGDASVTLELRGAENAPCSMDQRYREEGDGSVTLFARVTPATCAVGDASCASPATWLRRFTLRSQQRADTAYAVTLRHTDPPSSYDVLSTRTSVDVPAGRFGVQHVIFQGKDQLSALRTDIWWAAGLGEVRRTEKNGTTLLCEKALTAYRVN